MENSCYECYLCIIRSLFILHFLPQTYRATSRSELDDEEDDSSSFSDSPINGDGSFSASELPKEYKHSRSESVINPTAERPSQLVRSFSDSPATMEKPNTSSTKDEKSRKIVRPLPLKTKQNPSENPEQATTRFREAITTQRETTTHSDDDDDDDDIKPASSS